MSKINLLVATIIITLLSSCGFHASYKNSAINASITSSRHNAFADELQKRFNQNIPKTLAVQVGAENQNQRTASYNTSSNEASSYTLSLSVPIKVFNQHNKLLLSQTFSANTYLSKMDVSQADRLQIEEGYQQLRHLIIRQLLRKLSKLNEN
ncbi:LPS-assembly lipoprotein [Isorropodon fossajaponicum endosymbiont JTNG4]|uniref:LPS assembly lipoprotein LptE n=1 Tax=Isorropodon fossajaponicum symbiont TaxID=883811 RepID=UPI001914F47B|nr:LPS assembly lipoprotein LptE [Isorropodon fossajaponicum symbiont]BBB24596.1 LPS-assembly lipoprotein [Isorropodon fossajaponicum endosymbiont JTNG4]